jgi:2,4-dienoyl-CoA reductase-like NADH-dependent reductase (Old Yellow Enzyme family)
MNKMFQEYMLRKDVILKNRLVLAPMTTYASNEDLTVSDEELIYYNSRAKQFGMVVTAACAVSKNAQAFERQISVRDRRYEDSMKKLASSITKEGSVAVLQLHHGGRMNQPNLYHNQEIVAPSAVKANRDYTVTPRELKTSEIYDIMDSFVQAAEIALEAGFNGVELHGANTYLLQQFYSPHSNLRDDEFGGDRNKRMTFMVKLIDRIVNLRDKHKKPEFIIGYRLSPEEIETPGITIEDTLFLIEQLSQKDIDYIHLSTGHYKQTSIRNKEETVPLIYKVMEQVQDRMPIIGVGQIETLKDIENVSFLGYSMAAIGLAALADKEFVDHVRDGIPLNKEFNKDCLLPTKLFDRLSSWMKNGGRGYTVK